MPPTSRTETDLEFDDDTRRDIVMPTVAYTSNAKFELVELDDFSPADRASVNSRCAGRRYRRPNEMIDR